MKLLALILFFTVCLQSNFATSHDLSSGVSREVLSTTALQNIPGHKVTSLTVSLKPSISVPSHYHDGFVFVYVIKGTVLSQLNNEEAIIYSAGDSWIENPGDQHSQTKNMSDTDSATLLAVFVASNSARLTTPGQIPE